MITNNIDFYNYMRDKGEWMTLMFSPSDKRNTDELAVIFPDTHNSTVCGNRFNKEKENDYRKECANIIRWMQCSSRVIVVTPIIKFDSYYMKEHAPEEYELLQQISYKKQNIHTKYLGNLINPHRLRIMYVGIDPIKFDHIENKNYIEAVYDWTNDNGEHKQQQIHYINVLNATRDKYERRKQRYIPEYTLFSQLYKKLKL